MRKNSRIITFPFLLVLLHVFLVTPVIGHNPTQDESSDDPSQLLVLWTSGDREVALNMVFMYTYNAKKNDWWKTIRFIVWGASTKLLSEDKELQQEIQKMKDVGVELLACKACSDRYGVSEKLQNMGIEVKYVGKDFTAMLKDDWVTLTF